MVEVTESAKVQLDAFLNGKEPKTIRIAVVGGCGAESLGLSLEPACAGDVAFPVGGLEFLVPAELLEKASFFRLDYTDGCFSLDSDIPLKEEGTCTGHHHHDHGHHCH